MSSDRASLCERRANGAASQTLEMLQEYFWRWRAGRSTLPRGRQNLPAVYRRLTIPEHLQRYPGAVLLHEAFAMRIVGSNATARTATAAPASRRSAAGGFSVDEGDAPKSPAPAAALRTIGGIDALIALQGQEEPAERKRRAVKRGRIALDALDELKVEVLAGTLGPSTLLRLKSATADLRDGSGDAGLDSVLAEIELRLEVEIAKMAPAR
jgi:hypothetical protein